VIDLGIGGIAYIAALKYPRWGDSFYPVVHEDAAGRLEARYPFPDKISQAAGDGRLWFGWPEKIWVNRATGAFCLDFYAAAQHPGPDQVWRLAYSPPSYLAQRLESHRGENTPPYPAPVPLSKPGEDFEAATPRLIHAQE
jgi:hypothetical protein